MDRRWPRSVYGVGEEPDPRFSLANERTFLAWLRTALALMAGGVAVHAVWTDDGALRTALAITLLITGIACSLTAWRRWQATERALRLGRPLPASRMAPILGVGLAIAGALAGLMVLT